LVRTPNELKLLALVEEAEGLVTHEDHDLVAKDLYMAVLLHRGLQDAATVDGNVVFPRWFMREAGVIPVTNHTFVNISIKAKSSLKYLEKKGLIKKVNNSEKISELYTFRTTEAGREVLEARRGRIDMSAIHALTQCNRCKAPLVLYVDVDQVIDDSLGSHLRAYLKCSDPACDQVEEIDFIHVLTDEQSELMYMMSQFTHEGDYWITHNALRILIFEGIVYKEKGGRDVFSGWDYAPASVMFTEGRRYVNISQEAEDDLNDLRELGLIDELRMEGPYKQYVTKYQIAGEGRKLIKYFPESLKNAVDEFLTCSKCGKAMIGVICGLDRKDYSDCCTILCRNPDCDHEYTSDITDIEDVSYVSVPFWYGVVNPVPSRIRGGEGMPSIPKGD
jgi:DNA-binding PadR family transcriptional regulator